MKRGPKKSAIASIRREIEASYKRIAIERDKLRNLISESEAIADSCSDAYDSLVYAADAMSEYL